MHQLLSACVDGISSLKKQCVWTKEKAQADLVYSMIMMKSMIYERIRDSFQRSSCKSTNAQVRELEIQQTTVWRVLRRRLSMKPYTLQLLPALKPTNKLKRLKFNIFIQEAMQDENFI